MAHQLYDFPLSHVLAHMLIVILKNALAEDGSTVFSFLRSSLGNLEHVAERNQKLLFSFASKLMLELLPLALTCCVHFLIIHISNF